MKTRLSVLFIIICLSLFLASCSNSDNKDNSKEQANAYFVVFESLYEGDYGLNTEIKHIAVDLTNVKLADTARLIELLQNFCNDHEYILLQDTIEGLKEKGYIKDLFFKDGLLFSFKDKKLTQDTLITSAEKWRSGLGANGADYTVKKKNDTWQITKTKNNWAS